jgi:hypothetical protein
MPLVLEILRTDLCLASHSETNCSSLKPVVTLGQYIHFWKKKNVPVVNGIFCQDKMLEYAYN